MTENHAAELLALANGYQLSQALTVATALGLADLLAHGPRTVDDLAAQTGVHAPSLHRLLRALSARGVFSEVASGAFALTPLAEPLRRDAPDSIVASVRDIGASLYRVWGDLKESIRTGEPAFPRVFGMPSWEYRAGDPEASARFNARMTEGARARGRALAAAYEFWESVVVDVGGGTGALLFEVLRAHPYTAGTIYDLPHLVREAEREIGAAGMAERCAFAPGDFFERVPGGAERYILSTVLHDWDDERAGVILRRVREACDPSARLLIVEAVLPPGDAPHPAKMHDLHMLLMHGGRERSETEWRFLLARADFAVDRIFPLTTGHALIEAVPT